MNPATPKRPEVNIPYHQALQRIGPKESAATTSNQQNTSVDSPSGGKSSTAKLDYRRKNIPRQITVVAQNQAEGKPKDLPSRYGRHLLVKYSRVAKAQLESDEALTSDRWDIHDKVSTDVARELLYWMIRQQRAEKNISFQGIVKFVTREWSSDMWARVVAGAAALGMDMASAKLVNQLKFNLRSQLRKDGDFGYLAAVLVKLKHEHPETADLLFASASSSLHDFQYDMNYKAAIFMFDNDPDSKATETIVRWTANSLWYQNDVDPLDEKIQDARVVDLWENHRDLYWWMEDTWKKRRHRQNRRHRREPRRQ